MSVRIVHGLLYVIDLLCDRLNILLLAIWNLLYTFCVPPNVLPILKILWIRLLVMNIHCRLVVLRIVCQYDLSIGQSKSQVSQCDSGSLQHTSMRACRYLCHGGVRLEHAGNKVLKLWISRSPDSRSRKALPAEEKAVRPSQINSLHQDISCFGIAETRRCSKSASFDSHSRIEWLKIRAPRKVIRDVLLPLRKKLTVLGSAKENLFYERV